MQINGWYRIGIVVTCLWWIICTIWLLAEVMRNIGDSGVLLSHTYDFSMFGGPGPQITYHWPEIFLFYVVIPCAAWLLTIGIVHAIKWIRNGFHED